MPAWVGLMDQDTLVSAGLVLVFILVGGVFAGISNASYHGGPGISKSGLDIIRRSPLHYQHSLTARREPTPDQRIGTLAHALILEPETIWDHYSTPFVAPEGALATVEEFNAYFGTQFPTDEFDTIGGYVLHVFGHMPRRGESVRIERFAFNVQRADTRRVHQFLVTVSSN